MRMTPPVTIDQILQHHGLNTYGIVIYNDPFDNYSPTPFSDMTTALQYYYSQGFRVYACVDCSNGLQYYIDLYSACTAAGIKMTAPYYLWGYETQFYFNANNLMTLPDPDEQEYYLQGMSANGGTTATTKPPLYAPYSLIPALAFKTFPGMSIDAPALLSAFQTFYSQLDSAVGLKNLIGTSAALESDHPVNYMGAQGAMGGNNMNSYTRYVNSMGFYQQDVNASGNHLSDGTACALHPLIGVSTPFTGSAIVPTLTMALDVYNYHHYTSSPGGTVTNQSSSYAQYGAASTAHLEESVFRYFQMLSGNPYSFWRTAIPVNTLNAYVPDWTSFVTYQGTSSPGAAVAFMQQYPGQIMLPYFNYGSCDDNTSNYISGTADIGCPDGSAPPNPGYSAATPQTVSLFFSTWVPQLSPYSPLIEADTQPSTMQPQSILTSWSTLGPQFAAKPLPGSTLTPTSMTVRAQVTP